MKNLFSINKDHDGDSSEFDVTPYLTARVSPEIEAKLKGAFSVAEEAAAPRELSEEDKKLREQGNHYWIGCLVCLAAAVILFFAGGKVGIYTAAPILYSVNLALLAVSIFLNFKARRINRQQTRSFNESLKIDFSEASAKLTEAAAEAALELGVPANALTVDVFPYHYRQEGDKIVPVGKKGKVTNLSVALFVKNGNLCFATAQELFTVPLSAVTGYREYDEDFELDMWLKPEEANSDKYKAYGIRKCGFLAHKGHGYFGLLIGEDAYEVLIPCYDFEEVKALLKTHGVM